MKIIDWLGNFLVPKKDSTINFETFRMPESAVAVQAYSLFVCIDLVATISTKCSFGVFDEKGQIKKSALWVMLNVKPNKNQNAYEFWHELVAKLLSDNPLFVCLNSYTTGLQPTVMANILKLTLPKNAIIDADEIGLATEEGLVLPQGCTAFATFANRCTV